jgi:hypothetical protein
VYYMRCPVCGCVKFYVKDPVDEYETHGFKCPDGVICFDSHGSDSQPPEMNEETETYCNQCAWHDKFKTLTKKGD